MYIHTHHSGLLSNNPQKGFPRKERMLLKNTCVIFLLRSFSVGLDTLSWSESFGDTLSEDTGLVFIYFVIDLTLSNSGLSFRENNFLWG